MTDYLRSNQTLNKNLVWSAIATAIFVAVSLPQTYSLTDRAVNTYENSCPTPEGKFIHSALFFAINYFVMKIAVKNRYLEYKTDGQLARCALFGTLLFFTLSSTDSYALTKRLTSGTSYVSEFNCPHAKGVIVNALVFFVVLLLTMYLPQE